VLRTWKSVINQVGKPALRWRRVNVETKADRLTFERLLWRQGWRFVAGVDEAGRGPLVAAAVILPRAWQDGGLDERLR